MANVPSSLETALHGLPTNVLVGVSGGIDSVTLLHALVTAGKRPIVLHFDHGWRKESAGDAAWVRTLATKLKLRFIGGKMRRQPPRENVAREARYAFFARHAGKLDIPDLVLAHQADDQVETFLLQLLRGSGAAARGMDPLSRRGGLVLHRPWLGIWRKEIGAYARKHKLAWREDASNTDTRHRRNLVRHRILPYLQKQVGTQVAGNLWRAAEILRAESAWLDETCAFAAARPDLSAKDLRTAPLAIQRRTILRWLQHRQISDISLTDVEAVRGLLENRLPAKINLSAGKFARRREGRIFVE